MANERSILGSARNEAQVKTRREFLPIFSPPRRVPHGITLLGRLFDEGTFGRAALTLEQSLGVSEERPSGF